MLSSFCKPDVLPTKRSFSVLTWSLVQVSSVRQLRWHANPQPVWRHKRQAFWSHEQPESGVTNHPAPTSITYDYEMTWYEHVWTCQLHQRSQGLQKGIISRNSGIWRVSFRFYLKRFLYPFVPVCKSRATLATVNNFLPAITKRFNQNDESMGDFEIAKSKYKSPDSMCETCEPDCAANVQITTQCGVALIQHDHDPRGTTVPAARTEFRMTRKIASMSCKIIDNSISCCKPPSSWAFSASKFQIASKGRHSTSAPMLAKMSSSVFLKAPCENCWSYWAFPLAPKGSRSSIFHLTAYCGPKLV